MIAVGTLVRYAGGVYSVIEVRGERVVLAHEGWPGVPRIALASDVAPVVRRRSVFDGVA